MCQIAEAIHSRYRTCTFVLLLYVSGLICANRFLPTYRNPFLDSHPVFSAPMDVAIDAFDRVEMETTPSEVTGGLTSTFIRHFVMG
jgi:hypothetical protein